MVKLNNNMGNASSVSGDDDVSQFLVNNSFNFKGNEKLPICKQCYYCKCERFTPHEIKTLSNPDLTFEDFQKLDIGSARILTCPQCVSVDTTDFKYLRHNFREIWMVDYQESALRNNPFINISSKFR